MSAESITQAGEGETQEELAHRFTDILGTIEEDLQAAESDQSALILETCTLYYGKVYDLHFRFELSPALQKRFDIVTKQLESYASGQEMDKTGFLVLAKFVGQKIGAGATDADIRQYIKGELEKALETSRAKMAEANAPKVEDEVPVEIVIMPGQARPAIMPALDHIKTPLEREVLFELDALYASTDTNEVRVAKATELQERMKDSSAFYAKEVGKILEAAKEEFIVKIREERIKELEAGEITDYGASGEDFAQSLAEAEAKRQAEVKATAEAVELKVVPKVQYVPKKRWGWGGRLAKAAAVIGALFLTDSARREPKSATPVKPARPPYNQTAPASKAPEAVREPITSVEYPRKVEVIDKDDSIWRAARRLLPRGQDTPFSLAWEDPRSVVMIDGKNVPLHKVSTTHRGDTLEYCPDDNGQTGYFLYNAVSGIAPDFDMPDEITREDIGQ